MSNMKYDDTDYLINREESIEYKISLTKEQSIELLKNTLSKFEIRGEQLYLLKNAIENVLAEREQDKNRIKELKEENEKIKAKIDVENWQEKTVYESLKEKYIPKQKVKEILTEIQEEFNKLDKETDKQIKDKNKDYYKCKENIAIMQTLAYCRDKFEELLEEK